MKKAGLAALLLGAALCIPGCGFEEGAGATVTVIQASGINVTKQDGTYVTNADVNLRSDASADATLIQGVATGTELTSTGVCDNGWIEVSYNGQTAYVSGDYVSKVEAAPAGDAAAEGAADTAAEGTADAAAEGTAEAAGEVVAG